MIKALLKLTEGPIALLKLIPEDLLAITSRFAVFTIFWRSAQTKISGWQFFDQSFQFYNINESTFILFKYEYTVPLLNPEVAAYLATFNEFFLSIAILLGVATRFSALALLGMTTVIQIFVYPDAWPTHIMWAAILLYLIKNGAGRLSIDALFSKS